MLQDSFWTERESKGGKLTSVSPQEKKNTPGSWRHGVEQRTSVFRACTYIDTSYTRLCINCLCDGLVPMKCIISQADVASGHANQTTADHMLHLRKASHAIYRFSRETNFFLFRVVFRAPSSECRTGVEEREAVCASTFITFSRLHRWTVCCALRWSRVADKAAATIRRNGIKLHIRGRAPEKIASRDSQRVAFLRSLSPLIFHQLLFITVCCETQFSLHTHSLRREWDYIFANISHDNLQRASLRNVHTCNAHLALNTAESNFLCHLRVYFSRIQYP